MSQVATSPAEVLPQLEAARKGVLGDAHFYSKIVHAILPIVGPAAAVEVRRWGAEFLAETFATPALADANKEALCLDVLNFMLVILESPTEDLIVVKSIIQAAASLYTVLFRTIVTRSDDFFASKAVSSKSNAWQIMSAIKSNILRRFDMAPGSVCLCAIKFMQKVIQVQTAGVIADPRRPERNETSITVVPRDHPVLSIPVLEAEASGLLDRLLSIFQENSSDPILVNATLNCMSVLVRTRPSVANKIISTILNFNSLKLANSPMTLRSKVVARSLERTTRAFLKNIHKANPNGLLAPKIDVYLARLNQTRAAVFADTQSLKRPAPPETHEGLQIKRTKFDGPTNFPHMPPPPNSYTQLFTLTEDSAFINFDVQILPEEMVRTITHLTLHHLDHDALTASIGAVRERYTHLQKMQQPTPLPEVPMAGPTGVDDEDDYDPEYTPTEEATDAPAAATAQALHDLVQPDIALGPFELPKAPALTGDETVILAKQTVDRVFANMTSWDSTSALSARRKVGLNRVAASTHDRDAWVTMLTRLATRAPSGLKELAKSDAGLERKHAVIKHDAGHSEPDIDSPSLGNGIRQNLYLYVLEDFRSRINVAISWLNEEWYNERLVAKPWSAASILSDQPMYNLWMLRILDALLPYLDVRDNRLLIRFLSEIPAINVGLLDRVKSLARDPERVNMSIMALQYLILMRPPVREMAIDVVEEIWRDEDGYREANALAGKVLAKWRPAVLDCQSTDGKSDTKWEKHVQGVGERFDEPMVHEEGSKSESYPDQLSNGGGAAMEDSPTVEEEEQEVGS